MSEQDHPLGDEVEKALAEAFYEFRDKLRKIYDKCSEQQLLEFAGDTTDCTALNVVTSLSVIERQAAYMEVIYRSSFRRAKEVMDATGATGYCVFHDCDWEKCANEHDD